MGFLTGGVTYQRFRADGLKRASFGPDDLAKLEQHASGRDPVAAADGVSAGWTAGKHVLDLDFSLEKNVVAESLHFDLCVETERLPGDKLKAYYEVELKALSAGNPSGRPSALQK
jgi:hypothetical protein